VNNKNKNILDHIKSINDAETNLLITKQLYSVYINHNNIIFVLENLRSISDLNR
jgi:hypothetical protein